MATARRRRAGVGVGRAAVRAMMALVPPAHPSWLPSTPIATASSPPRKSVTPRPHSKLWTTTATACSTTPSSTPAVIVRTDPTARPTDLRKVDDSAAPQRTAPDGQRRGGRFGGPPPDGEDGPPGGGRAMGQGRARPGLGNVLPPFVREPLSLNDRQRKQVAELETYVKGKLESILSPRQVRQARSLFERGPGGPGGPGGFNGPGGRGQGGPGGRGPGPGGPPGFAPGDDDDGPPTRPRRPPND